MKKHRTQIVCRSILAYRATSEDGQIIFRVKARTPWALVLGPRSDVRRWAVASRPTQESDPRGPGLKKAAQGRQSRPIERRECPTASASRSLILRALLGSSPGRVAPPHTSLRRFLARIRATSRPPTAQPGRAAAHRHDIDAEPLMINNESSRAGSVGSNASCEAQRA
jgi:hypothetical protein